MNQSTHEPGRVPIEMDFGKQVHLSAILASVEEFRSLMDEDFYRRVSEELRAFARVLDESHDTKLSTSRGELLILETVVDAAWAYTNRTAGSFPITPLNQIGGLVDKDFCALIS